MAQTEKPKTFRVHLRAGSAETDELNCHEFDRETSYPTVGAAGELVIRERGAVLMGDAVALFAAGIWEQVLDL